MRRRTFLTAMGRTSMGVSAVPSVLGRSITLRESQDTTHVVGMFDNSKGVYFDPIGLYVEPGDTVRWVNRSGRHSTTSYTADSPRYTGPRLIPEDADSWNSGVLTAQGAAFEYTFEVKGTYDYFCIPHKTLGMVGRIVCGEPGGPSATRTIPSSDRPAGVMPPADVIVEKKRVPFPYVPGVSHGGPPALFWGGIGAFSLLSIYLYSIYDRASGRYDQSPETELGLGMEGPTENETDSSRTDDAEE